MNHPYGSLDPPRTLTERLRQLNDNLQCLGDRLKASIGSLVGDAIGDAVRDAVRTLLGGKDAPREEPFTDRRDRFTRRDYREHHDAREDDPWGDRDSRWSEEEESYAPAGRSAASRNNQGHRWRDALSAALQTCLWLVKQQPCRRPVLTTVCVTLAAGVTAFVAGPVIAAGAGVVASVAGLMLTADASKSAAELASD